MVERAAVNREVEGSSPSSGANLKSLYLLGFLSIGRSFRGRLTAKTTAKSGQPHNSCKPDAARQLLANRKSRFQVILIT